MGAGEQYCVREEGETGWTQTYGNDGYVVAATSGNDSTGNDFGNFENIDISGIKFKDLNSDHDVLEDVAMTALQFTINLYVWADGNGGALDGIVQEAELTLLDTTETSAVDGTWSFSDLRSEERRVGNYGRAEGEAGWTQNYDNDGYVVGDSSGNDSTGNDFGNFEDIDISGTKFNDINGDHDVSEDPAMTGTQLTINLYVWADGNGGALDGIVQEAELTLLDTTETSAVDGTWSFSDLGPLGAGDKYFVREEGEAGWTQTYGNDGYVVAATSGNDSTGNDFGNFDPFDISGTKYLDVNGDGSLDGDPAMTGTQFTINLYVWADGS